MNKLLLVAILLSTMLLVGCTQILECSKPNKVIGKECCLDEDTDGVCDHNQVQPEDDGDSDIPEPQLQERSTTQYRAPEPKTGPQDEPAIDRSYNKQPSTYTTAPSYDEDVSEDVEAYEPNYQPGISKIRLSEPNQWIQIHKLSAYRSSRDKGQMEWMYYTVRNLGNKPVKLGVGFMFQYGITPSGSESPIGKKYVLDELEPGEKITINQSLGMYFEGVEKTKTITLDVYDKMAYPPEDIQSIKKSFKPTDIMDTLEIMQYGRDD